MADDEAVPDADWVDPRLVHQAATFRSLLMGLIVLSVVAVASGVVAVALGNASSGNPSSTSTTRPPSTTQEQPFQTYDIDRDGHADLAILDAGGEPIVLPRTSAPSRTIDWGTL